MVKTGAIIILTCLLVCLIGCNGTGDPTSPTTSQIVTTSPPPTNNYSVEDKVAVFPNPELLMQIRVAINKPAGDIYQSDLQKLTQFEARGEYINNLTGLENCINLKYLNLRNTWVTDISPLASLTKLITLHLENNLITDIMVLGSLTNLQEINVSHNKISDISSLGSLADLRELNLSYNQVDDISPLMLHSGLIHRIQIDIRYNPLNTASLNNYIPQLQKRMVTIEFTQPAR